MKMCLAMFNLTQVSKSSPINQCVHLGTTVQSLTIGAKHFGFVSAIAQIIFISLNTFTILV